MKRYALLILLVIWFAASYFSTIVESVKAAQTLLTLHTLEMVDDLLIALDSDGDGDTSDETVPFADITLTGTSLVAQLLAKAPLADPTFTGEIGIGSVNVSETEFGILEDATPTTTELNYVDGVTSAIQTQFNNLAIGTYTQAWDAFLDDIAALTDPGADRLSFWDDSAGGIVWLTLGNSLEINTTTLDFSGSLKVTASDPTGVIGKDYFIDISEYDPATLGGSLDYWAIYSGSEWVARRDTAGTVYLAGVETPSRAHFANADAAYDDTDGTPFVLLSEELKGSILTNGGSGGDAVYTLPAICFGMNFMMMVTDTSDASNQMDLEPPSGDKLWLNGTEMAVDEHIVNAADTKGDVMSCWSVEVSNGVYELFCASANNNWAEETPP